MVIFSWTLVSSGDTGGEGVVVVVVVVVDDGGREPSKNLHFC